MPEIIYCIFLIDGKHIIKNLIKKSEYNSTVGTYYLEDNHNHLYFVKFEDKQFKVLFTEYREVDTDYEEICKLTEKYQDESNCIFYAKQELYGEIYTPLNLAKNINVLKSIISNSFTDKILKDRDLNKRSIEIYKNDSSLATKSFEKIEATPVEIPIVGTKLYKFINNVGVFEYIVTDILEYDEVTLYKLLCNSCRHANPCTVLISKVYGDNYNFVKTCDESNEHKFYHFDNTFFHTCKRKAYKDYLDKIISYNDRTLLFLNKERIKNDSILGIINLLNK